MASNPAAAITLPLTTAIATVTNTLSPPPPQKSLDFWDFNGDGPGDYGGGGGPTEVSVQIDIPDTIFDSLASNIGKALSQQVNGLNDAITQMFGKIGDILKNVGDIIWNAIKSVVDNIGSAIGSIMKGIASSVASIFSKIADVISAGIVDLVTAVKDIIKDIEPTIKAIADEIQSINDTLIQPIATFINTTLRTVATLTVAIEKDLSEGLTGLLNIPGDIANAMTSLDATMQRTVEELSKYNGSLIDVKWSPLIQDQVGDHLKSLAGSFSKPDGVQPVHSTFDLLTNLPDECKPDDIVQMLQTIEDGLEQFEFMGVQPFKLLLNVLMALNFYVAQIEQRLECYRENARRSMPITKLDEGIAISAWMRNFISTDSLNMELSAKGYDSARISVMKSLQMYLLDPDRAVDFWMRGIITEDDLKDNLSQHGIVGDAQTALIRGNYTEIPVQIAEELYVRGQINETDLATLYSKLHIGPDERAARTTIIDSLTTLEQEIRHKQIAAMLQSGFNIGSYSEDTPEDLVSVGKRNRLDPSVTHELWAQHYYIPGIDEAIQLYFRGVRTLTECRAIMAGHGVPGEIVDDLIQARRSLIPFRTIPSMVKTGALSEARARQILAAHGFTEEDVFALLRHAEQQTTTTQAAATQSIQVGGLASAKELYIDGALTDDQYRQVLMAHGYDADGANLEIQYLKTTETLKARKAKAQGIVDEASIGLITYDQAQTQLAAANFTTVEQAKYLKEISSALRKGGKVPSESELYKMLKAGIITKDDYISAMQINGYDSTWANRFYQMREGS